jgi:hypothetical protein
MAVSLIVEAGGEFPVMAVPTAADPGIDCRVASPCSCTEMGYKAYPDLTGANSLAQSAGNDRRERLVAAPILREKARGEGQSDAGAIQLQAAVRPLSWAWSRRPAAHR